MKHIKYPSLLNIESKQGKILLNQALTEHPEYRYVVQEKIHGANFAIYINNKEVKYASRNRFLDKGENFHNHKDIIPKWDISKLEEELEVIIFGEIFGEKVQKGVNYGPGQKFIAFDVIVNGKLLTVYDAKNACEGIFGLPYINTLYVGSLEKCLKIAPTINSTILGIKDNMAEGLVIKPLDPIFIGHDRLCFKRVNEQFKEKMYTKKNKKSKPKVDIKAVQEYGLMKSYLNENRIQSVISKEVNPTKKDIGDLIKKTYCDIIEDIRKDGKEIEGSHQLRKLISKDIANMLKEVLE